MFFAVGFETTAPANAMAVYRAKREGSRNFSLLVSHVLVPPAIAAILGAPDNRVQGFLAAGHVCTVMGYEEYEPIAARYRVPIVVTGFEPLDILEGVYLCVRQLEEGRAEVENQYSRVGAARRATRRRRRSCARSSRSSAGAGAASARSPRAGSALADAYRAFDAERALRRRSAPARRRPASASAGLVLRGEQEAARVPGLRHALHARASARRHHGLVRRRLRRLLPLSRRRRAAE